MFALSFLQLINGIFTTVSENIPYSVPGGYLCLASGDPFTSDIASSSTIYYMPFVHNNIQLWDGTTWKNIYFTEKTLALSGLTSGKNYDVFGYLSGGTLVLELSAAWTNDTTRADAVSRQDGRLCKTSDKTRLLLGTIRTIATNATCLSSSQRFVSNLYNTRVHRASKYMAANHTRNSTTVRAYNNDPSVRVEWVLCDPQLAQVAIFGRLRNNSFIGIGWDTFTTGGMFVGNTDPNYNTSVYGQESIVVSAGYHAAYVVEISYANGIYDDVTINLVINL